jgi:type I restriction enzyme S subunit
LTNEKKPRKKKPGFSKKPGFWLARRTQRGIDRMTDQRRPLPKGWEWTTIGEIVRRINPGFASGKHNKSEQGIPHLRPMNVSPDGTIDLSEVKYVEVSNYDALQKGDVLFNNTNSPVWVGKTAYISQDSEWAYSNHMTRLRFYPNTVNSAWIAYCLHYLALTGFFQLHCKHHVNQASINIAFLSNNVKIPLPPSPNNTASSRPLKHNSPGWRRASPR